MTNQNHPGHEFKFVMSSVLNFMLDIYFNKKIFDH